MLFYRNIILHLFFRILIDSRLSRESIVDADSALLPEDGSSIYVQNVGSNARIHDVYSTKAKLT
jgi:hypothetical protein